MDGLWCSFNDCHMIELAQYTAEKAKLTRARIDEFSLQSQHKAAAAQAECRFSKEIVAVSIPQRKGDPVVVAKDESVRADTTLEALAKLAPVTRDKGGVITAGTAPGLNDGGAALIRKWRARAGERGPIARWVAYAPRRRTHDLFFAPIDAVQSS
jgi:acetyl-CoA C-acetyltransferase